MRCELPEGWEWRSLSQIAVINKSSLSSRTPKDFAFRYFDVSSATEAEGESDEDFSGWTTFGAAPSRARRLAERGDVVYATIRPLLRRILIASGDPAHVYSTGFATLGTDNDVESRYLYHCLTSDEVEAQIFARVSGSSFPALSVEDLAELELPWPPSRELDSVTAILDTWDHAIESTERLIVAKEKLRDWIRTSLLTGNVRLRGHSEPWRAVLLSEVLHEHGARSRGDEPVFSVSVHKGLVDQIAHLGRSFSAADTTKYNRVLPGDIVYTKSPTGEFPSGIIKQSTIAHPVIVSPLYAVYTPRTYALGVLLDARFESPVVTGNYLKPLVQKGAKNTIAITNRRFLEGSLYLPDDEAEIDALAEIVQSSRRELFTLDNQLTALRAQKRGLMQKLLTGEWQLPERPAEAAA